MDVSFLFTPVQRGDNLDDIPEAYDPIEVDDHGEVDLFTLVEDELIISLPIVAMHDQADCAINSDELKFGELSQDQERKNPFAILKELKRE
jgi:uncharacterized protein